MSHEIELIKAFSNNPEQGNPAGVIFDADDLSQSEMIEIAAELGYSESVFILKPSEKSADYRFRFMTSTTEVDACGHATLAGAYAITQKTPFSTLKVETAAGIVNVERDSSGSLMMKMPRAELGEEIYDADAIAKLLNIDPKGILNLPIHTASVGSPKLMIPISSLKVVSEIKPDFDAMITFCKANPVKGFYVFTSEVIDPQSNFHARQFNPAAGIFEDPITGVAGGALMLYARKHKLIEDEQMIVEQGYEMNKPGQIIVRYRDNVVFVGGRAVRFGEK